MRNLSDPKYQQVTDTTAKVTVRTDTDHGNMRWTVDPEGNIPTEQQVFDGQNAEGNPATASGNFEVFAAGQQPWQSVSGLSANIEYAVWFSQAGLFYSQQPTLIEASTEGIDVAATGVALGLGTTFIDHHFGIWPGDATPTDQEVLDGTGALQKASSQNIESGTRVEHKFLGGIANTRYSLHWMITHPDGRSKRGETLVFYFTNTPPIGAPYITPNTDIKVGDTLTCNTENISDPDGLGPFTYQWYANGVPIPGATSVTYVVPGEYIGRYITVSVSYIDGSGEFSGPIFSDPVGPIIAGNIPAEGQPVVEGDVEIGEILTANTVGIHDANGIPPGDPFTYQWQHFDNADIVGATSKTYEVQPSDEGKQIRVFVTFIDGDGYEEGPLYSEYTVAVPGENFPAEGQPVITGTVLEGEELTADTSGITDANGIPAGDPYSYQWQSGRSFGLKGITLSTGDIPGATGKTYTPTLSDTGNPIRVYVTFTDNDGHAEGPLYSDWTINVPQYNRPAEGKPSISGNTTLGSVLTAGQGTITDVNGVPSIDQFTWQWKREGTPIAGATSITYVLVEADVGSTLTVEASFTDLAGFPEGPLESDPTDTVVEANSPATGNPVIYSAAMVGNTLTCTVGTIQDGNGFDEANFQYKWYRNTSTLIPGATSKTYVVQQVDVGNNINATVEFIDNDGYPEGPLASNQLMAAEDLSYFHNFDTATDGGFTHTRASDATTTDYVGNIVTVTDDVEAYPGGKLNGSWADEDVGYGIQLEEERTNYTHDSEDLALWSNINDVTISDHTENGPLNKPAEKMLCDATNAAHMCRNNNASPPAGTATLWYILHPGNMQWVQIYNLSSGVAVNYDLINAVVGRAVGSNLISARAVPQTNGYVYVEMVSTVTNPSTHHRLYILEGDTQSTGPSWLAEGTEYILYSHCQHEAGALPTSYIPTTANAAVTRAATSLSAPFSALSPLPAGGVVNDFCIQTTGIWKGAEVADGNQQSMGVFNVYSAADINRCHVGAQAWNGFTAVAIETDGPILGSTYMTSLKPGDRYDLRIRKRSFENTTGDGLKTWLYVNGVLVDTKTGVLTSDRVTPVDCSGDFALPLDYIEIARDYGAGPATKDNQITRIVPAALTDEEVEAWEGWTTPAPIMIEPPTDLELDPS